MSRDLHASVIAEIQQGTVRPVLLYEGEFASGWARLWSGIGDLSWNGYIWSGVGTLAAVSAIEETAEIKAAGITVTLSGIPSDVIALALAAARQGMVGRIYVALLDTAGAVVGEPYLGFEGRLDVPVIEEGGETSRISIAYESRLIDLEKARERRYTHEDQQLDFPGDLGFEFVPALQNKELVWRMPS